MTGTGYYLTPLIAAILAILLLSNSAIAVQTSEITALGDSVIDRSPSISEVGGMLVAAWLAYDGSGVDIMYSVRNQGAWAAPGKLAESAGYERDLVTCSSGNLVYAAWATDSLQYTTGSDWDIVLSVYEASAGWSSPVELTDLNDSANDYAPFLLPYQSGVIVLWQSLEGVDGHIMMATYISSASEPVDVTETWKEMNQNPTAALLGDTLWIAWSSNDTAFTDNTDLDIVAAPYHLLNHSLGPATQLSDPADTEDDLYPCMLALNGNLHIAWQSRDKTIGAGDDEDVGLAVYTDSWTTHALTSSHDTGDDTYPLLFSFEDNLWLAWQSSDSAITGDAGWDIIVAPINGTVLGEAIVVSEGKDIAEHGGTIVRGHDAIQAGEDIVVIWETTSAVLTDGTDSDIAMATLPQTGQDKIDDGGSSGIGIIPIFAVVVSIVGFAVFLLRKKWRQRRKESHEGKKERKKHRRK